MFVFSSIIAVIFVVVLTVLTAKTATIATAETAAETAETAETIEPIEKWFAHDQELKSAYDVFESEDIEYCRIDDYGDWAVFSIKGISLQRRFGRYNMVAKVAYYGNRCHIIYGVIE